VTVPYLTTGIAWLGGRPSPEWARREVGSLSWLWRIGVGGVIYLFSCVFLLQLDEMESEMKRERYVHL
jgi:hypothetical protein